MLIYALIGGVGLFVLLVMLFVGELFGGDHDVEVEGEVGVEGVDHDGPSIFSTRVIATFLTAFGGGGLIARYYALSHPLATLVGFATGTVFAALAYQFGKLLYRQQASSELRMADLVGQTAEVIVSIPAGGVGQIAITFGGQHTTHIARAADGVPIPGGAEVRITALRGDGVVVRRSDAPTTGGE